jgi:hypothetical protein
MLQINSGKLYPNGVQRTNELRGVLYSNLFLFRMDDGPIVTAAGRLQQADATGTPRPLIYEITEKFEDDAIRAGVLISHTVQPYLRDFAAVVSFILRVTCTPDADLCARLLNGKRSLGVMTPPDKLVRRVFDKDIFFRQPDIDLLKSFTSDLIALERKSFLATMRAIRTYVTSMHRLKDDLELAYMLLVASIESLSQDFDAHKAQWSDYEQSKRQRIDKALANADGVTAKRVRTAILEGEHLALARRFREFVLAHLSDSDFQESGRNGSLGRLDLRDALKEAYGLRSRYVHSLRDLPHLLDTDLSYSESIRSGHATYLTLEGLSRIARKVILEFVARRPKCETERYDYRLERYGIVSAELAPQYWIWRPDSLVKGHCRKVLSALLSQLAAFVLTKSPINDLHQVCAKIEGEFSRFRGDDRRACAAIYILFNCYLPLDQRRANYEKFHKLCAKALQNPSIEALCLHLMLDSVPSWNADDQRDTLDSYFEKRNQKGGLRVPELFEAGMLLSLAERYRSEGQLDQARTLLAIAAVNAVHFPVRVSLHAQFAPDLPIDWRMLLPGSPPNSSEAEACAAEPSPQAGESEVKDRVPAADAALSPTDGLDVD